MKLPVFPSLRRSLRGLSLRRIVDTLLQFIDKVVDILVVAMRQTHSFQKTIEIHQLQVADKVSDVPVAFVMLVPQMQVMAETAETPQLLSVVQVPQGQVVPETVEIPKLPFHEKIVVILGIQTVQGPQTSESLNSEISTFQLELRMVPVEQVACETCVKDNTAMVAREVTVAEKANHETVARCCAEHRT